MPQAPGTRLGVYEIVSSLGAGGMGEVYRARDTRLKRDVALKILPDHLNGEPDRLARFQREAEVLASLNHPNIAHIHGFEDTGSVRALVMELVEGEDLAHRLARGPIPLDEAMPIARQIAEALEAAHEQGIVHRDLKPANIKVRPDGSVKVLDFGLAKAAEPVGDRSSLANSPTVASPARTQAGVVLGTAGYMSPEQARGKAVDRRADIWAFGCVLFEMLSGEPPFGGDTVADVLSAVVRDDLRWNALPDATQAEVRRVLRRCLEKNPRERLRDIGDAIADLRDVPVAARDTPRSEGVPAPEVGARSWVERSAWSIALVVAMAIGYWLRPPSPPTESVNAVFSVPVPGDKTTSPGTGVTPNGQFIARLLADPKDGVATLWVRALDGTAFVQVPGTERATGIFWSPDSSSAGFVSGNKLRTVRVTGGPVTDIADVSVARGGSWSKRGVVVFAGAERAPLYAVPASGGAATQVTELDTAHGETSHRYPSFLPDGNHFVFLVRSSQPEHAGLYLASLDDPRHHQRLMASDTDGAYSLGHLLFMRNGTLLAQRFDTAARQVVGDTLVVAEEVDYVAATGRASFGVSENGVLTYFSARRSVTRIASVASNGAVSEPLTDPGFYADFAVLRDGRSLVFTRRPRPDAPQELWFRDPDHRTETRLVTRIVPAGHLVPSGSHAVLVATSSDGLVRVHRHDVRGLVAPSLVKELKGDWLWDVSRDERVLAFRRGGDLLALVDGVDERQLESGPAAQASASINPSASWIAYLSDETGRQELYVRDLAGTVGRIRISTAGAREPVWADDGRTLFYRGLDGSVMSARVEPAPAGARFASPTQVFAGPALINAIRTFKTRPDGGFVVNMLADEHEARSSVVVLNWLEQVKKRLPATGRQ